ncbi:TetR/AcrR family transcriptional regulator [Millisia brevis]|uniref:TetR/AcrR family transcriptional regulator n=1 Tax=Millisia brevis TaxID=264148 RepID=UPI00082F9B7F|nr:TetR/AcrR family transcriptional regulator [Millisia brevis]
MEGSRPEQTRREQRTADSRARILDAATRCLVEDGYARTTTLRIQQEAGVSRGRLLHHFPSREALLVAAAEHVALQRIHSTVDRIERPGAAGASRSEQIRHVIHVMWQTFHEPHFSAALELWTAARTNTEIAGTLLPGERLLGEIIDATITRMWGPELSAHPRFPMLRELLMTSMRGAALVYTFRPRDPATDPHLSMWVELTHTLLGLEPDAEPVAATAGADGHAG